MRLKIKDKIYEVENIKHNDYNKTTNGEMFFGSTKFILKDNNEFCVMLFKTCNGDGTLRESSGLVAYDRSWDEECDFEILMEEKW